MSEKTYQGPLEEQDQQHFDTYVDAKNELDHLTGVDSWGLSAIGSKAMTESIRSDLIHEREYAEGSHMDWQKKNGWTGTPIGSTAEKEQRNLAEYKAGQPMSDHHIVKSK
jgi:hypothetical protein